MNTKFKKFQNSIAQKIHIYFSQISLKFGKQKQSIMFDIKLFWKSNKVYVILQIIFLLIMMTFIRCQNKPTAIEKKIPTTPQYVEFETFVTTDKDINDISGKIPYKRWREGKIFSIITLEGMKYIIQVPKLPIENIENQE